jgi:nitrate reductase gamma subunit
MKPTSALPLVLSAVGTAVGSGLLGLFRLSHGQSVPVSPLNILLTLPAIAVVLLALAYPIYRYRKQLMEWASSSSATGNKSSSGHRPKRLDPFYAVRVLLLAKASSLAGSIFAGWHIGLVVLQLTTPVISLKVWSNISGLVGSVITIVVGLIVERLCRIPDSGEPEAPASGEVTPA